MLCVLNPYRRKTCQRTPRLFNDPLCGSFLHFGIPAFRRESNAQEEEYEASAGNSGKLRRPVEAAHRGKGTQCPHLSVSQPNWTHLSLSSELISESLSCSCNNRDTWRGNWKTKTTVIWHLFELQTQLWRKHLWPSSPIVPVWRIRCLLQILASMSVSSKPL